MAIEMMNTLHSKYFLCMNLGTHYCDEPIKNQFPFSHPARMYHSVRAGLGRVFYRRFMIALISGLDQANSMIKLFCT
jgi:hypothetical protein